MGPSVSSPLRSRITRWTERATIGSALVVALALALARLRPTPTSLGRPRRCAEAQLVDGVLRCDEELSTVTPPRCPGPTRPVRPGDMLSGCALGRMAPEQLAALAQAVDLNRASIAELSSLEGIGPVLAGRIVAARPLASVDALLEVPGIGPAKLAAARGRAYVGERSVTRRSR